jgi:hypothetical protein
MPLKRKAKRESSSPRTTILYVAPFSIAGEPGAEVGEGKRLAAFHPGEL